MASDKFVDDDFLFDSEFDHELENEASKLSEEVIQDIDSYQNLKNIQKKTLGLFILKLLKNKAHYGYEIKQAIKEEFDVNASQISTYKTLYKLNHEGLVTCRLIEPFGSRSRKYYFITPTGIKLLIEAQKFLKNFYNILFDSKHNDNDF